MSAGESMRRKLAGAVDPDALKAALSLVGAKITIRCSLTALAGRRSSSASAVHRFLAVVKDIDGMVPMPTRARRHRQPSHGKQLTFVHSPECLTKHRQAAQPLLRSTVAYLDDITSLAFGVVIRLCLQWKA